MRTAHSLPPRRIVYAPEHLALFHDFLECQRQELIKFNVSQIASADPRFIDPQGVYLLVCEVEGQLRAGARIHLKRERSTLPIEIALKGWSEELFVRLGELKEKRIAEVCGVWVHRSLSGKQFGKTLVAEATAFANELGMETLVALVPQHPVSYFKQAGFEYDGRISALPYPDGRFVSRVVWAGAPAEPHYMNRLPEQERRERA